MANYYCKYLEYEDTGWFSYRMRCSRTGLEVGNEHDHVKVDNLCDTRRCYDCPLYRP